MPGKNLLRAVPQQHRGDGNPQKLRQRRGQVPTARQPRNGAGISIVLPPKTLTLPLLGVKTLDDAQSAQRLLYQRHNHSEPRLGFAGLLAQSLPDSSNDDAAEQQQNKHKSCERRRYPQHVSKASGNDNRLTYKRFHDAHDAPFHLLHIGGKSAHEVAFAFFGEKRERQVEHFTEHLLAQITDNSIAHRRQKIEREVAKQVFTQKGKHEKTAYDEQRAFPPVVDQQLLKEEV